ncbi:MAG TPA: hypothetical protein VKH42_15300 [Vicinamibacterales bacterium]|nr:hypothetical protein [Vicinamibacterales bacterium]
MKRVTQVLALAGACLFSARPAQASGHGPVFGATTPTLGRGGWSIDWTWALRDGESDMRDQMLKTMISYGLTERLQLSGSFPLAMSDPGPAQASQSSQARMMSLMSNDREYEGLLAYRFQSRTIGIGGRQESTVYIGGNQRSPIVAAATGYASRSQYVWAGGDVQKDSVLFTVVYGYRPPALRTEAGKPDLRFFVEATAEDTTATRTVFIGPTALLLHNAIGIEGGVLFPAYQRRDEGMTKEHIRVAVNVAYFFWIR